MAITYPQIRTNGAWPFKSYEALLDWAAGLGNVVDCNVEAPGYNRTEQQMDDWFTEWVAPLENHGIPWIAPVDAFGFKGDYENVYWQWNTPCYHADWYTANPPGTTDSYDAIYSQFIDYVYENCDLDLFQGMQCSEGFMYNCWKYLHLELDGWANVTMKSAGYGYGPDKIRSDNPDDPDYNRKGTDTTDDYGVLDDTKNLLDVIDLVDEFEFEFYSPWSVVSTLELMEDVVGQSRFAGLRCGLNVDTIGHIIECQGWNRGWWIYSELYPVPDYTHCWHHDHNPPYTAHIQITGEGDCCESSIDPLWDQNQTNRTRYEQLGALQKFNYLCEKYGHEWDWIDYNFMGDADDAAYMIDRIEWAMDMGCINTTDIQNISVVF